MIVEQVQREVTRVGQFRSQKMGIEAGNEALVYGVLRRDLYSDPKGSLLREYLANAQDSHRAAGIESTPIEITFPASFSPELHIRDFGKGLTVEQVFRFFGNFGASDKREQPNTVGFFGLGCKSGHAYRDSFVVTSYQDGLQTTFNCFVDESEVGEVALINQTTTDEPDGLKISVTIEPKDIQEFVRKGLTAIRYFKTPPIIKGLSFTPNLNDEPALIAGDGWSYHGQGTALALMGEIPYPIDANDMGDIEAWERQMLNSKLILEVGIGEVAVVASREALRMNDKTISAIRAKLVVIRDRMVKKTSEAFNECQTLVEAKTLYNDLILKGSGYGVILREANAVISWKGQKIDSSIVLFDLLSSHRVLRYEKSYKKFRYDTGKSFTCERGLELYYDDTNRASSKYRQRVVTIAGGMNYKTVTIIQTDDVPGLESILGMSIKSLASLNAVEPTLPPSAMRVSVSQADRNKHKARVFRLDRAKLDNFSGGFASAYWTAEVVELSGGLYIPIERFHPTLGNHLNSISQLKGILDALKLVGIACELPIYGLKPGEKSGDLVRFDTWLTERLKNDKPLIHAEELANGFSKYKGSSYSSKERTQLFDPSYLPEQKLPANSVALRYLLAYKEAKTFYGTTNRSRKLLFTTCGMEIATDNSVKKLSDKFRDKYPMLKYLSGSSNLNDKEVFQYIQEKK